MKIKPIFTRTIALLLSLSMLLSVSVTIAASDLNDFFNQFEEINETGYFKNDSVDLYYNPVQEPEKKVSITRTHMPESFLVEYKFTDDTGKAWYIINTEEWLPDAVIEDVYPGYVSEDEVTFSEPGMLTILRDGNVISDAVIERNASMDLTVDNAEKFSEYHWQILHEEQWVNILDATSETICITYPMVSGMLDGDESAQIRCVAYNEEERAISEPITITVEEESEEYSVMTARAFSDANEVDDIMPADETADSGSELETYTVTIHYQYEDGKTAAPSWDGQFSKGAEVNQTIKNPTVTGFAPLEDSYTIYISSITEDTTYFVTYYPAEVDFTVYHYQQNVENDSYTLKDTQTLQGITGSTVGEGLKKEYEGFYAYNYDTTLEIAADGSTVVEIYYDRYYYLLSFDLNGGYGVEPIYARYGTPISVGTPNRPGYSFTGWDGKVPLTMPAGNTQLEAQWDMASTAKVSVVFWGENPNDEGYSYQKTGELELPSGTQYTFTEDSTVFVVCGMTPHTHTNECLGCELEEHTTHTEECFSCSNEEHIHGTNCYDGVGEATTHIAPPANPQNGQIYSWSALFLSGKSIYINGTWYKYTGEAEGGSIVSVKCGTTEHRHTNECYGCTYHVHGESCYSCGKDEHIHTSACNQLGSGMDSSLWTFVRSDTVTVAPDGSTVMNVYYDRVSYNVEFHENINCTSEYTDLRITAKWGQSILNEWPTYNGSSSWLVKGKENTWQNSIQVMPVGGAKFWGPKAPGGRIYKATYYVEALPGDSDTFEHNGVTYKYHHEDISVSSGNVTDEEKYDIEGFTYKEGTSNGESYNGAKFYYTRNQYTLEFNNGEESVKKESVLYEFPLSSYGFTPKAPSFYEPGSREFAGWYLNPECTGAEYVLNEHTMPANDLILYAKWTPKTHTVTIYKTDARVPEEQIGDAQTVPHGSYAVAPTTPTNGSYSFVGWFYKGSDGIERGFDFSMPVNQDLELYAKWSSNVLVPYTIRYAVKASDGTYTYIAPETTGQALAGQTKTFLAKAGDDLDDGYREGYFPETSSHSITPSAEDAAENTYTFVYVKKDEVPYTVRYIEKGTNIQLEKEKTVTTSNAIVTETFVVINGYMPDAYQKTLVLSANGENIITFWYIKDDIHAPVQVIHYIQNAAGDGYTVYQNTSNLNTEINDTFSADILQIDGFVFDHAKANKNEVQPTEGGLAVSGTVTAEGLVLELYYNRNLYPYAFRFVEKGTNIELAPPSKGEARYGAQVVEKAAVIPGYACAQATGAIVIKMEDEALQNVYTFYYERALADLTIKKSGAQAIDKNQSFIFEVKGTDPNTKDISLTVVVIGDGSVTIRDLPVGEYTVEEKTGWSWRYTPAGGASQKVTVDADGETVDFANKRSNELWLDGNHWLDNRFKIKETPADETLADEEVEADA